MMKKVFVLMLSLGTITTVFAQDHRNDKNQTRDVVLGSNDHSVAYSDNDHRYNAYNNDDRRKEAIDKINREIDFQIAELNRDYSMNRREKQRRIQQLEKERTQEIKQVNERFYAQKDIHTYDRDNRRF